MKGNKKTGTRPEIALRSALHARGLRFRRDLPVRVPGRRPIRVDVVFTKPKLAVFVDGCFWHACPTHGTMPSANRTYWEPKLIRNVERDREVDRALTDRGWTVMRIWEHVKVEAAASQVAHTYSALTGGPEQPTSGGAPKRPPSGRSGQPSPQVPSDW